MPSSNAPGHLEPCDGANHCCCGENRACPPWGSVLATVTGIHFAIDENGMVVHEKTNCIEPLLGNEIEQFVHGAPMQATWHRIRALASPPIQALDVEALAVGVQEAVRSRLKAGGDLRAFLVMGLGWFTLCP